MGIYQSTTLHLYHSTPLPHYITTISLAGVADLEVLCQELEDQRKEGKRERKRKRRERRREGRVATAGGGEEREESDGGSVHSGDRWAWLLTA